MPGIDRERALDILLVKQEISDAMMRYCRGIDRHDEDLIRSVYHEDAYDDHGFGGGAPAWDMAKAYGQPSSVYKAAQHFIGNLLVEVDGETAASETYFIALQRFEHDEMDYDFVIAGRYLDRWERRDEVFKISRRTLVWDWMRTDPVRTPWPGPDSQVPKPFWGGQALATDEARFGQGSKDDFSYELIRGV